MEGARLGDGPSPAGRLARPRTPTPPHPTPPAQDRRARGSGSGCRPAGAGLADSCHWRGAARPTSPHPTPRAAWPALLEKDTPGCGRPPECARS